MHASVPIVITLVEFVGIVIFYLYLCINKNLQVEAD